MLQLILMRVPQKLQQQIQVYFHAKYIAHIYVCMQSGVQTHTKTK